MNLDAIKARVLRPQGQVSMPELLLVHEADLLRTGLAATRQQD